MTTIHFNVLGCKELFLFVGECVTHTKSVYHIFVFIILHLTLAGGLPLGGSVRQYVRLWTVDSILLVAACLPHSNESSYN